jgi:hypothetical protein
MSRWRQWARLGALSLALTGCGREPAAPTPPLALRVESAGTETRLFLVAAPGWKINARLKPALEVPNGDVVRFDAARLTPDSAYFAEAPSAAIPGGSRAVSGTLRASVCAAGELVCRAVTMKVRVET